MTGWSSSSRRRRNTRIPQVLKYLARYLTGGPISDGRLIDHQDGKVTFWAVATTSSRATNANLTRSGEPSYPPLGSAHPAQRLRQIALLRRFELSAAGDLPRPLPVTPGSGAKRNPHRPKRLHGTRGRVRRDASLSPLRNPDDSASPGRALSWQEILDGPDRPWWYDPFRHAISWGCLDWYREPPDG